MIDVAGLTLTFRDSAGATFPVLDIPRLTLEAGRLVVITGPSGSGKSSLLYALSGLQAPTTGTVTAAGCDLYALAEARRDRWRRAAIGFVFQDFHLIEELSPLANVTLPLAFGASLAERRAGRKRARGLLEQLGVPLNRTSSALLSRGERQRTAIARALLFDPPILLADEPTASLDAAAADIVCTTLRDMARGDGRLVLAVSHDPILIAAADTVYRLEHGALTQGAVLEAAGMPATEPAQ
ncbi:ABC transporter ATP-binding protein [Breoghania sp. L-A4]|uniref:ABC transporter ATP-binding protein n=1 Tax=Breoghania sp. L-A4 TaxID=2304600 RepID=UPI000E35A74D|nr:ABC transporter ATP-binding protein [Breoghania sp. L-A4]AXS40828.1 ABC transporter ATP-binding protein [Breoghania sp. L-A4]